MATKARVARNMTGPKLGLRGDGKARPMEPDNVLSLYFQEVGRTPLLTAQEETELARDWQRAKAAEERLKGEASSPELKRRLLEELEEGRRARERLIKANARLVISVARKFAGRGVPLSDLIQEGNLGLMRAIDRFDPERGFRFSTYAIWWVRQAISRAIADQGRTIRLPTHVFEELNRVERTKHRLTQELGRLPTPRELGAEVGVDEHRILELLSVGEEPLSLDTRVGEEESSTLADFIEDQTIPSPNSEAVHIMVENRIEEALGSLTPREAEVLRLRFGIEDGRPYTLEEVGERLGLTRERIRQIQTEALRRLRHPSRSRALKGALN